MQAIPLYSKNPIFLFIAFLSVFPAFAQKKPDDSQNRKQSHRSETEWKEILSPEEFYVLRKKGTERPYSGAYEGHWESGIYVCKGCGSELFYSDTKFDAGCGWPSFYSAIEKKRIREIEDLSLGMRRIEVQCAQCGGHLGHVFPDGPDPTGLRYCINSISLGFKKKE